MSNSSEFTTIQAERIFARHGAPLRRWIGACVLLIAAILLGHAALALLRSGCGPERIRAVVPQNPNAAYWTYAIGSAWGLIPLTGAFLLWNWFWPYQIRAAEQQGFPLDKIPLLTKIVTAGFVGFALQFLVYSALALNPVQKGHVYGWPRAGMRASDQYWAAGVEPCRLHPTSEPA